MADFPTLAILAGIPIVLLTYFLVSINNVRLSIGTILFSFTLLSALGYSIDTGHASQGVFESMVLISLTSLGAYLIFLGVLTVKDSLISIKTGVR